MAAGASGRRGNHAAWRVEEETGRGHAHALSQHQNGMEKIVLGQIHSQRAAMYKSVKVDSSI